MKFLGTYSILGTQITACDYDFAVGKIENAVVKKKMLLLSPIASQTVVRAYFDLRLKKTLAGFTYLFPDSQWIRWSLGMYGVYLPDRVYGPNLMLEVCRLAEKKGFSMFLYGNTNQTLLKLRKKLKSLFPKIKIAGSSHSIFKPLSSIEKRKLILNIEKSDAKILLVALGSPLEQHFSYELLHTNPSLKRPLVVLPVGAAFDFIAEIKPQAPAWVQKYGFEWLFRMFSEPKRLWKRYVILGPLFVFLIIIQGLIVFPRFSKQGKHSA